jgi:hypothetical protein
VKKLLIAVACLFSCGGPSAEVPRLRGEYANGRLNYVLTWGFALNHIDQNESGLVTGTCIVANYECSFIGIAVGEEAHLRLSVKGFRPFHFDGPFAADKLIGLVNGSGFDNTPAAFAAEDPAWLDDWIIPAARPSVPGLEDPVELPPFAAELKRVSQQ